MDGIDRERAQAITRLREKKLWSRRQLAREAGMSPSAIPYIEEHRGSVRLETIGKIAKALDVDPKVILYPDEHQEEIYGPKAEAPSPPKEVEERRIRRLPAEELRRAVDSLKALNETRRQEIAHHDEEGAAMPDEEWARDVEARERMLTEDFREQGILDYARAVNDGREMASDDVRRLCLEFDIEFHTIRRLSDMARLIAGLAGKRTEVETRRFRSQLDAGVPGLVETEAEERRVIEKIEAFVLRWQAAFFTLDKERYEEYRRHTYELVPFVARYWENQIKAKRKELGREPRPDELSMSEAIDDLQETLRAGRVRAGQLKTEAPDVPEPVPVA